MDRSVALFCAIITTGFGGGASPALAQPQTNAATTGRHAALCRAIAEVVAEHDRSVWGLADFQAEQAEASGAAERIRLRSVATLRLAQLRQAEEVAARYRAAPEPDFDLRSRIATDFDTEALRESMHSSCSRTAAASASPPIPSPVPTASRQPLLAPPAGQDGRPVRFVAEAAGRGGLRSQDILCPPGDRAAAIEILGIARVTGVRLACAPWAPGAVRSGPPRIAGHIGLTDGAPRLLNCAPDRWLTAIQVELNHSQLEGGARVISFARPLCRGDAALRLDDDAAPRSIPFPPDSRIQRTDCPQGPAVGLRAGFDQSVKSLALICPV